MFRPSRLFPSRVVVGGFVVGSASRWPGEAWRVLCGSTPEDTVSSDAIRDESRSSTRVPWLSLRVSRGCVRANVVGANPCDGASFSQRRTISLLNSVSFPYETHFASAYVSPSLS